jgi:hypothetical protein
LVTQAPVRARRIVEAARVICAWARKHNVSAKRLMLMQPVSTDHLVKECSSRDGDR